MPKIEVKGQTFQTGECPQTNRRTPGPDLAGGGPGAQLTRVTEWETVKA